MRSCDNRLCCNPEYRTVLLHSTQRTHCRNGHLLTEENTEIRGHSRNCLTCSSQSSHAAARRKVASLAVLPATFRITDAQGQHHLASSWQDLKEQLRAKGGQGASSSLKRGQRHVRALENPGTEPESAKKTNALKRRPCGFLKQPHSPAPN